MTGMGFFHISPYCVTSSFNIYIKINIYIVEVIILCLIDVIVIVIHYVQTDFRYVGITWNA